MIPPLPSGQPRPLTDPRSRVMTRTAASLADTLDRLRLDGLQPGGATRLVIRASVEWAESLHWLPVTEMPLAFLEDTREYPGRQGIVDLYVARPGYRRDLVIEVDRGNKVWSAAKLGHCVRHGRAAIWVRWSGPGAPAEIVPPGVEVIHLEIGRPARVEPAEPAEDTGALSSTDGLSGASRALLAALYPFGAPEEDEVWREDTAIWERVGQLRPRLDLILRCRFGKYGPRPLTLARSAEVVADELNMAEVTRERIRQLQVRALRQLRARSMAHVRKARRTAGLPPPAREPQSNKPPRERLPRKNQVPEREELRRMVVEIVRAAGDRPLRPSMVCHVLRGSEGPVTRRLVEDHRLPHDGALHRVSYRLLHGHVLDVAKFRPLRIANGYLHVIEGEPWAELPPSSGWL